MTQLPAPPFRSTYDTGVKRMGITWECPILEEEFDVELEVFIEGAQQTLTLHHVFRPEGLADDGWNELTRWLDRPGADTALADEYFADGV